MSRLITARGFRSSRRRPEKRRQPRIEPLEDRRLLATFNPSPSAADGGANSLRAAIIAANANGQDNTINLQAGTYQLTLANGAGPEDAAATGDLDLTSAGHTITIIGQGAGSTIVDGGGLDRVFQIMEGVTANISNLTIQNGLAQGLFDSTDQSSISAIGGGIFSDGTIELDGVVVQDCTAKGGDGLPGSSTTVDGGPAFGGGIAQMTHGSLTLDECIIRDNSAIGGRGGEGGRADTSTDGGSGGFALGGGIVDFVSLTIRQSAIVGNHAVGGTGGTGGFLTNGSGSNGGRGREADGGGVLVTGPQTLIIDSTIAANEAVGGAGGHGQSGSQGDNGASGGNGGDGSDGEGGGIAFKFMSLDNSTIAGNRVQSGTPGPGGGAGGLGGAAGRPGSAGTATGGGIWGAQSDVTPAPFLTSISNIIAGNSIVGVGADPDVSAAFTGVTNTLLGSGVGATGITGGVNGNIVGVNPMLGPLQDNGGPTPTMALLPGSPAIDAGANPLNLTSDQRGFEPRSVGVAVDIGAFEVGAAQPTSPHPHPQPGAGKTSILVTTRVVKKKGRRQILVFDAATNVLKFTIQPFGRSHQARFQVTTRDVQGNGIDDILASFRRGRNLITWTYSGKDGSLLSVVRTPVSKR